MRKSSVLLTLLLWLIGGTLFVSAQSGIRILVVNEFANVRIVPAIGAEVLGSVPGGYVFENVNARSADGQWIRVDFNGDEGWVNLTPTIILEGGDVNLLPVADPRTIPYGGFESPRAGASSATSDLLAEVTNGVRIRSGPSQGYPTIGNMYARTIVHVTGRTASNGWAQVNYNGILGWTRSAFLRFLERPIYEAPIDGVVADSPPIISDTGNDYFDVLKLFLSRLDLAQPSIDNMRGKWTDSALTGFAVCRDYPARPSDYIVPQPVLAQNYAELFPVQQQFNEIMANLRQIIDLYIEICDFPGTNNPVGEGAASNALALMNVIDTAVARLRTRLNELLPSDLEPGPDECLLLFRNRAEILKLIPIGTVLRQKFTPDDMASGFCFEAAQGQVIQVQVLRIKGNANPIVAISQLDNPTNFLGVGQIGSSASLPLALVNAGPLPATARYLLLLYDDGSAAGAEPPNGEVALVIYTPVGGISPLLIYDEVTDTVSLSGVTLPTPTPTPFGTPFNTSSVGTGTNSCPSVTYTCSQLFSCQEAYACLAAGNLSLDPDGDGIPCTCGQ
ncbi:MAG: SH3 domain-containing protein [Chloroflexi bacterium]|nr:SH3 domain-containing protein [Chloroflexota bacterium]